MDWKTIIDDAVTQGKNVQIVIGLSAGKDSTAVALLFQKHYPSFPNVHYIFADTGSELLETYEYLDRLEKHFNITIQRLTSKLGTLEERIAKRNGYLPNHRARYCTQEAKIAPFREYMDALCVDADLVVNLVGIRSDEPSRVGYQPCGQYAHKVVTLRPLADEGMNLQAVLMLVESTVGLPSYYQWRTRSGCYFCFFQRRIEWINLLERHPDLYEKAKSFEKTEGDKQFTWIKDMSLTELQGKAEEIKARYRKKMSNKLAKDGSLNFTDAKMFETLMAELEPDLSGACSVCR